MLLCCDGGAVSRDALEELAEGHRSELNSLAYAIMFNYMRTQLHLGLTVIVDCPFARRELFDHACTIAKQVGYTKSSSVRGSSLCVCGLAHI